MTTTFGPTAGISLRCIPERRAALDGITTPEALVAAMLADAKRVRARALMEGPSRAVAKSEIPAAPANGSAASRAIAYMAKTGERLTTTQLGAALAIDTRSLGSSLAYWERKGLLATDRVPGLRGQKVKQWRVVK